MSVQFGIWNFEGKPVAPRSIEAVDPFLSPYAPDGVGRYVSRGTALVCHALHATPESHLEKQPYVSPSGRVYVWDGRLDNRDELIPALNIQHTVSDIEVFAASFDKWGAACFAKLLGDWAVTVWNEEDQLLILARDLMGIRPLYYLTERTQVRWCSILDPIIALAHRAFELNEEYVAGWLAMYPAADSTPYVGVTAVPPCSFVKIRPHGKSVVQYWNFDRQKRIVYRSDSEYQEHFRVVFRKAVHRRLRSAQTVCCELSGGMDSPSVTCMADLIANSSPDIPNIVTLSSFDDSEPHANERPYVEAVEKQRGRAGLHIEAIAGRSRFELDYAGVFQTTPAAFLYRTSSPQSLFFRENDIRVVLSGLGGDEVMGGVPTPQPEFQDLIVAGRFRQLAHQLKLWALNQRRPWFFLLLEAIGGFLPPSWVPKAKYRRPVPWLTAQFIARHRDVLSGFEKRVSPFLGLPSFQINLSTLEVLRRQFGTKGLSKDPAHERRYPFLDRDLLEFAYAIPREQLVRPGYRRALMRQALTGIVPSQVLERRRKAYANRGARVAISHEWDRVLPLAHNMAIGRLGIVEEHPFREALEAVQTSEDVSLIRLLRTILVEVWLRNALHHGMIAERSNNHGSEGIRQEYESAIEVA